LRQVVCAQWTHTDDVLVYIALLLQYSPSMTANLVTAFGIDASELSLDLNQFLTYALLFFSTRYAFFACNL
jgi:hypothetical protein